MLTSGRCQHNVFAVIFVFYTSTSVRPRTRSGALGSLWVLIGSYRGSGGAGAGGGSGGGSGGGMGAGRGVAAPRPGRRTVTKSGGSARKQTSGGRKTALARQSDEAPADASCAVSHHAAPSHLCAHLSLPRRQQGHTQHAAVCDVRCARAFTICCDVLKFGTPGST